MNKKIKNFITALMMLSSLLMPVLPLGAGIALAATSSSGCGGGANGGVADQVANGATQASGSGQTITCDPSSSLSNSQTGIGALAKTVVNIFSIVVGAASIIMIMYGGFRYITSGGSSDRVGNAKNTIIYAIIGLVIVGIAQILVHFVLSQSANLGGSIST